MGDNPSLRFDADLSPAENIELFLRYMEAIDPGHTEILRACIHHLQPLEEAQNKRAKQRSKFTADLLSRLAKLPTQA